MRGWFIIDLLATIPFQLIELAWKESDDVKLIRFTRVPRIYRVVRVMRLLKMFRVAKRANVGNPVKRLIGKCFNMTSSMSNLVQLVTMLIFVTHFVACFFFL